MRKHIRKIGLLSIVFSFALVSCSTVLALPSQASVHAEGSATTSSPEDTSGSTETKSESQQSTDDQGNGKVRSEAAQLKSCQKREKAITNIMARIADRGQKHLTLFSTIATRTETFYTNKGKTLSNYDALVADVNAKAAAAQTAVNNVKAASSGFSCDSGNPKGFISTFKSSLKSEITALQAYRTAVKNLIVGVKSVQSVSATSSDTAQAGGNQ